MEAFPILSGMEGGYRGHDGIRRWWAGLTGTFPDFRAEVVEVRDFGDLTLAVLRMRGHGVESDTPVDAAGWQVSHFRDGRCLGWRVYDQRERGPRSRGAVGVADVAGERGACASRMYDALNRRDNEALLREVAPEVEGIV